MIDLSPNSAWKPLSAQNTSRRAEASKQALEVQRANQGDKVSAKTSSLRDLEPQ